MREEVVLSTVIKLPAPPSWWKSDWGLTVSLMLLFNQPWPTPEILLKQQLLPWLYSLISPPYGATHLRGSHSLNRVMPAWHVCQCLPLCMAWLMVRTVIHTYTINMGSTVVEGIWKLLRLVLQGDEIGDEINKRKHRSGTGFWQCKCLSRHIPFFSVLLSYFPLALSQLWPNKAQLHGGSFIHYRRGPGLLFVDS